MTQQTPRILFIGVGAMGNPMAACLLRAGYQVTVFDTQAARMQAFVVEHGGEQTTTPSAAAAHADIVIMILPNSRVVESLLFEAEGIAGQLKPGTVVIDMTSGVPSVTQALAERLSKQGVTLFDAPVSGAVARAVSGELTIMVGGSDVAVLPVMPVLQAMGTVTRTGPVGSGDAMKALNNLVSCGGYLIGIEALLIGSKFGLDADMMVDVLNASTGMNNSTQKKFKQYVLSRKFNTGFPIHMMLKDLDNAVGIAHEQSMPAPFSQLCRDLWAAASTSLGPQVDHTALALFSEQLGGGEIK